VAQVRRETTRCDARCAPLGFVETIARASSRARARGGATKAMDGKDVFRRVDRGRARRWTDAGIGAGRRDGAMGEDDARGA